MQKTLRDLRIGTYDNIEVATEETTIITALHKFVERRVSALPLVNEHGHLVDIYAKFDVIVSVWARPKALIYTNWNTQIFRCMWFLEFGSREDLQRPGRDAEEGQRAS